MNKETSIKTLEEFYAPKKKDIKNEIESLLSKATEDCQKSRTANEMIYHRAEKETLNKVLTILNKGGHL